MADYDVSPDPLAAALQAAVAAELRHVGRMLERLADVLVGDEHFVLRHLDQLQQFDLIVQAAEENAAVLDRLADGACPHSAVAPVRLGSIQDRLRASLKTAS